jgi:hypothetical protein
LRTHILLERPADQCCPGGKLISGVVGYIADRDSSRHSIIMLLLALIRKPVLDDQLPTPRWPVSAILPG